jgi:DNA-binding CsgD family transcriptional regulator
MLIAEMNELLNGTGDHRLTPAEFRVLDLSLAGQANKEIAWELHISPRTVKFHLANIYAKLGIHGKMELLTSARVKEPRGSPHST